MHAIVHIVNVFHLDEITHIPEFLLRGPLGVVDGFLRPGRHWAQPRQGECKAREESGRLSVHDWLQPTMLVTGSRTPVKPGGCNGALCRAGGEV